MSLDFVIFKLTYSGSCERLSQEDILSKFTLFDILTFYISSLKRLYIWIGKRASQNLKRYIPQIRDILLEENPDLTILRNYTIESGSEPENFLELIGITQDDLTRRIDDLELKLLPSLSEINKLKESVDKLFLAENYEKALEVSEKIKFLAIQIQDKSLEQDQVNFLEEVKSKLKIVESLDDIEKETRKKLDLFEYLVSKENYREAHHLVSDYIENNEKNYPLNSIPIAQRLIVKDNDLVDKLRAKQEDLKEDFIKIEREFLDYSHDFSNLNTLLRNAKITIKKILDKDFTPRWKNLKNQYHKFKKEKVEKINNMSSLAINYLDDDNKRAALELFEKILSEIKDFT